MCRENVRENAYGILVVGDAGPVSLTSSLWAVANAFWTEYLTGGVDGGTNYIRVKWHTYANFSGDKKAWQIYLTIGNIKLSVQSKPIGQSLILLGLLPIPPIFGNNWLANSTLRCQSQMAQNCALEEIFQSIRECSQEGELIAFADRYERSCFSVLSGWIVDQLERTLQGKHLSAKQMSWLTIGRGPWMGSSRIFCFFSVVC
jgi:hypothetical protein